MHRPLPGIRNTPPNHHHRPRPLKKRWLSLLHLQLRLPPTRQVYLQRSTNESARSVRRTAKTEDGGRFLAPVACCGLLTVTADGWLPATPWTSVSATYVSPSVTSHHRRPSPLTPPSPIISPSPVRRTNNACANVLVTSLPTRETPAPGTAAAPAVRTVCRTAPRSSAARRSAAGRSAAASSPPPSPALVLTVPGNPLSTIPLRNRSHL